MIFIDINCLNQFSQMSATIWCIIQINVLRCNALFCWEKQCYQSFPDKEHCLNDLEIKQAKSKMCKDTFPCGSKKVLLNSTTEIVAKAFSRYSRCRKMISSSLTCTRFRGWRTNHICSEYIGKCHYNGFQFLLRAPIQYNPLQIKIYHHLNDFENDKDLMEHKIQMIKQMSLFWNRWNFQISLLCWISVSPESSNTINPLQIKIYHYLNDFRNSKDLWEHQHLKLRWWSSILLLDILMS